LRKIGYIREFCQPRSFKAT